MTQARLPLFRQQAIEHHRRLYGDVLMTPPLRWQMLGYFLGFWILVAAAYLVLGQYSRTITADGSVRPIGGMADIAVLADGILVEQRVNEGDAVARGQVLATISLETASQGRSMADTRREALDEQGRAIREQASAARATIAQNATSLEAAIADEERQVSQVSRQIIEQQALIASSEQELARIKPVVEQGFISGRDLQQRRELLISRRQELQRLEQARSAHQKALAQAQIDRATLASRLSSALGSYDVQQAQVRREKAEMGNSQTIDIVASADGIISALQYRRGDSVRKGEAFARIVPSSQTYEAEIRIAPSSIGQVAKGQEIRLALESYPIADYGLIAGRVSQVSAAPTQGDKPYFKVIAVLAPITSDQRAKGLVLRPGLSASARIVLDRRSFRQWIFDPISAVTTR